MDLEGAIIIINIEKSFTVKYYREISLRQILYPALSNCQMFLLARTRQHLSRNHAKTLKTLKLESDQITLWFPISMKELPHFTSRWKIEIYENTRAKTQISLHLTEIQNPEFKKHKVASKHNPDRGLAWQDIGKCWNSQTKWLNREGSVSSKILKVVNLEMGHRKPKFEGQNDRT